MKTNLVALSKPSANTDCKTAEQLIAYMARVSNPKNQTNHTTASKLVRYLITENHWSPLEMVNMTIEIKTTRDIARQILRHRSFAFQEFSQRYAKVNVDDFTFREARLQDNKNRQNSISSNDEEMQRQWNTYQKMALDGCLEAYQWALDNGIAKEQARAVLPEGMTPSVMYMQGSLRSWLHYCLLRMGNGTQKEHTMIANEIWLVLHEHFPSITTIFHEHQREIQQLLLANQEEQDLINKLL